MSYRVDLDDEVADQIRRLKPRIHDEVLRGLAAAGEQTSSYERMPEGGPLEGMLCFRFRISLSPRVLQAAAVFRINEMAEAIEVLAIGTIDDMRDDHFGLPRGAFMDW